MKKNNTKRATRSHEAKSLIITDEERQAIARQSAIAESRSAEHNEQKDLEPDDTDADAVSAESIDLDACKAYPVPLYGGQRQYIQVLGAEECTKRVYTRADGHHTAEPRDVVWYAVRYRILDPETGLSSKAELKQNLFDVAFNKMLAYFRFNGVKALSVKFAPVRYEFIDRKTGAVVSGERADWSGAFWPVTPSELKDLKDAGFNV